MTAATSRRLHTSASGCRCFEGSRPIVEAILGCATDDTIMEEEEEAREGPEPAPAADADEGDEAPIPRASSKQRHQQKTALQKATEKPSAEVSPRQVRRFTDR